MSTPITAHDMDDALTPEQELHAVNAAFANAFAGLLTSLEQQFGHRPDFGQLLAFYMSRTAVVGVLQQRYTVEQFHGHAEAFLADPMTKEFLAWADDSNPLTPRPLRQPAPTKH